MRSKKVLKTLQQRKNLIVTQLQVLWKDWAQCMRMFQLRLETTVKITYGNVVWDLYVKENFFAVHTCLSGKKSSALVELISCISSSVTLVKPKTLKHLEWQIHTWILRVDNSDQSKQIWKIPGLSKDSSRGTHQA